jgi:hypothetical protein
VAEAIRHQPASTSHQSSHTAESASLGLWDWESHSSEERHDSATGSPPGPRRKTSPKDLIRPGYFRLHQYPESLTVILYALHDESLLALNLFDRTWGNQTVRTLFRGSHPETLHTVLASNWPWLESPPEVSSARG